MSGKHIYKDILNYIEASNNAIDDLQSRLSNKPVFSKEALENTGKSLVEAEVLSREHAETLIGSFRESPDKALESLCKLAADRAQSVSPGEAIGSPVRNSGKTLADSEKQSDLEFLKDFDLI